MKDGQHASMTALLAARHLGHEPHINCALRMCSHV
eukprot:CAMPEP_0179150762 /NCGR_PEP_ID=MMETSP0796-20121207/73142_1 /TAXON_ID=73915 /ORGANISM="Pyrodinium bahamense, Strain pbaha01" /LENGTH=34 /DNA_ID= /DNA_START= /DNA_END= /DNA_ORIENTATION=